MENILLDQEGNIALTNFTKANYMVTGKFMTDLFDIEYKGFQTILLLLLLAPEIL